MDNYAKLYKDHTALLKHREWRGVKDTAYDYYRWLVTWKDMIKMVLKAPVSTVKGLWNYRWMASYLAAPAFVDRHCAGLRDPQLRMAHLHYNMIVKHTTKLINISFRADEKINPNNKLSKKIVLTDEIVPNEVFMGFPNLIPMPLQTVPIFLSSMVDQQITPPYLEVTESFGVPLRYDDETTQEYAVEEIKSLIRFVEEQTGEKFDWNAYFDGIKDYNKQLDYERQKWDINKTPYPQMTGACFWLYRIFYFNLSGGSNKKFLKVDEKVNKIMMKAYEKKTPVSKEMRHRAIVWSCPANYYTSFANWLENCWGVNVIMEMETMISYLEIDENDKEQSIKDLARTYQRSIMRKHTKGGYRHVVDELWRIVEEYNADTVIMYDQISCKGMDGLNGIFDDQARERGVNFIWVRQDLMNPRTISRREMRDQVNKYMQTVLQEDPLDASLVDFEDDLAW